DYPYRDDGMLIWNAIRRWVGAYVGVYYLSDSAVINDYELAAWTKDVAGSGRVKGFVTIQSRQQLIDVLTLVIFNASAQHAAVNFSQPDYCLYAPALSALSWSIPGSREMAAPCRDSGNRSRKSRTSSICATGTALGPIPTCCPAGFR
ncbi:lipoxygenase family protein, partial [Burkholderia gladioli]|uniref:lipoxygenase family protein n=1 Tax=Burkholderia gladioli TaxID=28095 RepID=UPI002446287F